MRAAAHLACSVCQPYVVFGSSLPSDHRHFDLEFHDRTPSPVVPVRLRRAAGRSTTDGLVDQPANQTYHEWRGMLGEAPPQLH